MNTIIRIDRSTITYSDRNIPNARFRFHYQLEMLHCHGCGIRFYYLDAEKMWPWQYPGPELPQMLCPNCGWDCGTVTHEQMTYEELEFEVKRNININSLMKGESEIEKTALSGDVDERIRSLVESKILEIHKQEVGYR